MAVAALAFLGLALVAGLVIVVVTSVNLYAKRLADEPEDRRRGFEVKQPAGGDRPPALREKDDHHG
jgi:hypothetical protein